MPIVLLNELCYGHVPKVYISDVVQSRSVVTFVSHLFEDNLCLVVEIYCLQRTIKTAVDLSDITQRYSLTLPVVQLT